MENSHKVKFGNLVDAKTGESVELEVPSDLVYEGRMLLAKTWGKQSAQVHLACMHSTDPDKLFGLGL